MVMTGTFKYMKVQNTYMQSPEEVISKASNEKDAIQNNIREVADWFHDQEGGLIEKSKAINRIENELDISSSHDGIASDIVSSLAGDHVDPVQHVSNSDGQFVGVIEYNEHNGYYSFTEYHDISGKYTRAVCANCIENSTRSSQPFTRHTGKFGNRPHECTDELDDIMSDHVDQCGLANDINTGATLASGTTISSNTSIHLGNSSQLDFVRLTSTVQTSDYTSTDDDIVLADASGGAINITLPSPDTGLNVTVKKIDSSSNNVTIVTPGAQTIDGSNSLSISSQFISRSITSDGNNYFIV